MSNFQTKITEITEETQQVTPLRKPFSLPPSGEDEKIAYVTAVKQNSPFEYITIYSICFCKRVMPTEATYAKNEGIQFFPMLPCCLMTEKQAKAIFERAREIVVTIPGRDTEKEYKKAYTVLASDWIILCKTTEYNLLENPSPRIEEPKKFDDPLDVKARDKAYYEEKRREKK